MFIFTVYWLLCAIAHSAEAKNTVKPTVGDDGLYDGAQVWKVKLQSSKDAKLIQHLMNMRDISLWKLTPKQALFLVRMENKLKVHLQLSIRDLNHTVIVMDVQRRVDDQELEPDVWDHRALRRGKELGSVVADCSCKIRGNEGHRMSWNKYPTVEVVNEYIHYLTKNYPSVCKQHYIGKSIENETIKMLRISNGNPKNKAILLISGAHAREWIAITSALSVMREIATKFDSQPKYVQGIDWYIIPLLNPDGYRYTYQHDRLWRKNRSRNRGSECYGVDLNRNFDLAWEVEDVTETDVCSEVYSGPHAFSEPETIALRNLVEELKSKTAAMVDFHSFGQTVLFPWSHKAEASDDHSLLNATAAKLSAAMLEFKSYKYTYGQTYHAVYPASGSLLDWMYSVGIRQSYVIEGRDEGSHGFLMPAMYIQESGHEMLVAVTRLAEILDKQLIASGRDDYTWFR